jgi:hypothetical protein
MESTTSTVPNPIGIHALVWVGDTSPASVESAITQTADAGYDILEISLHGSVNLDVPGTKAPSSNTVSRRPAPVGWPGTPTCQGSRGPSNSPSLRRW